MNHIALSLSGLVVGGSTRNIMQKSMGNDNIVLNITTQDKGIMESVNSFNLSGALDISAIIGTASCKFSIHSVGKI